MPIASIWYSLSSEDSTALDHKETWENAYHTAQKGKAGCESISARITKT